MKQQERFWTIPNILSLYRILVFPLLLFFLLQHEKQLFTGWLAISLVTDILDGFIARNFNQQTKTGAKLDSIADIGSYLLAFAAIATFEWGFVVEHIEGLIVFILLYLGSLLAVFIRFGGVIGLHIYSCKITGYLQGGFLLLLLWRGNVEWFFWMMIIFGCLAKIEETITILLLKQKRQNVKGLYWVIKNKW